MKDLYVVFKSDVESSTVKYICETEELAKRLSKELEEREIRLGNPNMGCAPKFSIHHFIISDSTTSVEYPKYILIRTKYFSNKKFVIHQPYDVEEYGIFDNDDTDLISEVITRVSDNPGTNDDNDIEFEFYLPVNKESTTESMKKDVNNIIENTLDVLSEDGYSLNNLFHGIVSEFDKKKWNPHRLTGVITYTIGCYVTDNPLIPKENKNDNV